MEVREEEAGAQVCLNSQIKPQFLNEIVIGMSKSPFVFLYLCF